MSYCHLSLLCFICALPGFCNAFSDLDHPIILSTVDRAILEHAKGQPKQAQEEYARLLSANHFPKSSSNEITFLKHLHPDSTHYGDRVTVLSLIGISFCQSNEIEKCAEYLTKAVNENPSDWVAWEFLASTYSFLARRLYASLSDDKLTATAKTSVTAPNMVLKTVTTSRSDAEDLSKTRSIEQRERQDSHLIKKYNDALRQAVRMFKKSLRLFEEYEQLQQYRNQARQPLPTSSIFLIQSYFAKPRTDVYRNVGDNLLWLGEKEESREFFRYAVQEKQIWENAWCRPAEKFALKPSQERRCNNSSTSGDGSGKGFCERSNFLYIIEPFEKKIPEILSEYNTFVSSAATATSSSLFTFEQAGLHAGNKWKTLALFTNGKQQASACLHFPLLCSLVSSVPETKIQRGQVKFSVMTPSARVLPHCGPTNNRLRMHCALLVPKGEVWIKVANESRHWEEGKCFVFDESCEHEVWHGGTGLRIVLIVDFLNPDLDSMPSSPSSFGSLSNRQEL